MLSSEIDAIDVLTLRGVFCAVVASVVTAVAKGVSRGKGRFQSRSSVTHNPVDPILTQTVAQLQVFQWL